MFAIASPTVVEEAFRKSGAVPLLCGADDKGVPVFAAWTQHHLKNYYCR